MKSKDKNFICRELEWDSNYFGVKCGRIDFINKINEKDKLEINDFLKNYGFIVLTNAQNNSYNNKFIGNETQAFLTDVNIQLKKEVNKNSFEIFENEFIKIENNKARDEEIINLASKAFKNSRFLNDENITKEQACGIYINWVKNSFNKDNKYFITYEFENKTIGFILLSKNCQSELIIELICVSEKNKNNGIGKKLMNKVDLYALNNECKYINVGTQVENITALNFYKACGYKIKDIKYIYHFWNK